MLYLNVKYPQKDAAKALGAKWNSDLKKWFVPDGMDYFKFKKWFVTDANIICDNLYLVETQSQCWKCRKQSRILCLASDDFYIDLNKSSQHYKELTLFFFLLDAPKYIKKLLSKYGIDYTYSKQFGSRYLGNVCEFCGSVQGDFFLHKLENSKRGFYQCVNGSDENLKLHKLVNLPEAVELIGLMHIYDPYDLEITEAENLMNANAIEKILQQAQKDEIDVTSYLEETQVKN